MTQGLKLHNFLIARIGRLALMNLRAFFLLLGLFFGGAAWAESFAKLTVTPSGEQHFDIASGVITLPQGGEIVDAERGIRVESAFIRYLEGAYIEAAGAVAEGKFGRLEAETLYLDLATNELRASGGLELENGGLLLRADELSLFLDANIARLSGRVSSTLPAFETDALIINLTSDSALLVAPYRFQSGPLTLTQNQQGSLLQLTQETLADGTRLYNPSTLVQAEVLETLTPYLPH